MITRDFSEWQDMMAKEVAPTERIECPDCYGWGENECDSCGCYSECDTCEGKGKVYAGDVTEKQIRDSLTIQKYTEALEKDLTDLASWTGKDRISLLTENGLKVYFTIDSKREIVELSR